MRSIASVICLSLILGGTAGAQTTTPAAAPAQNEIGPADQLLQKGKDEYRAGRFTDAVQDLRAASSAFLSPEEKQRYVDTGKLATLPQVEQSLVYLALAYAKLGKDNEARDAVTRLANAERIAPTFASLPLDPDAVDFIPLVARLAPNVMLPQNAQLAQTSRVAPVQTAAAAPTPVAQPASMTPQPAPASAALPAPAVAAPAVVPPPVSVAEAPPAPAPAPSQPAAAAQAATESQPPLTAADRAEILRLVDERVAEARAEIERAAAAKIAEIQKDADARVAAERAAADKAAQEKIAAERAEIQRQADAKLAADRTALEQAADAKVAEARAAAQREAEQKITAARAVQSTSEAADAEKHSALLTEMRKAESLAQRGNVPDANRAYVRLASTPDSPRDVIAAAATGLYRTGDYADAVSAFRRLGNFARGEEDLRYYYAVSLFETGRFDDAKRELACALPYIQVTNDVDRYRTMIERMPSQSDTK